MDRRKLYELIRDNKLNGISPEDLLEETQLLDPNQPSLSNEPQQSIDAGLDLGPSLGLDYERPEIKQPKPMPKFPISVSPEDLLVNKNTKTSQTLSGPIENSVDANQDLGYLSPELRQYAAKIMPNLNLKQQEDQSPVDTSNVERLLRGEYVKEDPNPITDEHVQDLMNDMQNSLQGIPQEQNIQIPFRPDDQVEQEVKPTPPVNNQQRTQRSQVSQQSPQKLMQPQIPQEDEQDMDRELAALDASSRNKFSNILLKQISKLGASAASAGLGKIGAVKADTEAFDELSQLADQPIKLLELEKQQRSDKEKSDPNSDISVMLRNSLEEMGMDMSQYQNLSYKQLEKIYPSLTQALYTKMAAEARKQEAIMNRQLREEAKRERQDARQFNEYTKVASGIDRMVDKVQKSDAMSSYNDAKEAKVLLAQAATSNNRQKKIEKAAAFMNYAKLAQGDSSVVRSEDMKTLAGSLNYASPETLLESIWGRAQGTPFSDSELKTMSLVADTIEKIHKSRLKKMLKPIVTRSEANDYNLAESIDPETIDEIVNEPPTTEERLQMMEEKMNKNQARIDELKRKQQGK
jgi:hypothetical protein